MDVEHLSIHEGNGHNSDVAPWLSIPSRAVSVVEHPCIIKNVDKGITSLGGAAKLSKALRCKPMPDHERDETNPDLQLPDVISASLRPDDPYAKRILSTAVTVNNLLLKVTVPKRTGRKRKRGTAGPFLTEEEIIGSVSGSKSKSKPPTPYVDASVIYRSVKDNATEYSVAPVGIIDEAHRFRALPDIQVAASQDPLVKDIKENFLPLRYSRLKDFNLNLERGANLNRNIAVSAEYLQMPTAYSYKFQQNPFVKYTGDARNEVNLGKRLSVDGYYIIETTVEQVPTGPKPHLPAEHTLPPLTRSIILRIRQELARRPIITRHLLYNIIGWSKRERIREAAVYCGYFFVTGAWREALISWGLDPRKDPYFRKYQTVSFLSFHKVGTSLSRYVSDLQLRKLAETSPEELATQHIFDGVHVSETGNLFQFCDITDPLLRGILDTSEIRETCTAAFPGWYHIGTWAKATVILKDKMNKLLAGEKVDDSFYDRVLAWPAVWSDKEIFQSYRSELYDRDIRAEKIKEHNLMQLVRYAAMNPKYAFDQMEERDRRAREGTADPEHENNEGEEDQEVPEDLTEAPDTAEVIFLEGENDKEEEDDDDDDGEEGDFEGDQDEDEDEGANPGLSKFLDQHSDMDSDDVSESESGYEQD
ncbi:RNA polymerase III transcription factor IIIC subunit-domain-containing protein [Dendryphion nanum]|uniref:RNA polymerase III transcription factor IIIC subunit-domain-containing protein n=1 Tax=Dendryphion nanum TaxID=256645 RepID=A0A9P9E9V5_9PLEO|nr:RNA polymerase III transcription factor IIIC subunit-domain-containing protein [Dendryphion nanum]